jgi:hypothetical protein
MFLSSHLAENPCRNSLTLSVMHLTIRLDRGRLLNWHVRLVERLARRPATRIVIEWAPQTTCLPSFVRTLFALEKVIYGLPNGRISDPATPADFAAFRSSSPDFAAAANLMLDLSGTLESANLPVWQLAFDGIADEEAAIGALADFRLPVISIIDAANGERLSCGLPGVLSNSVLVQAFEDVLSRATTMIFAALDRAQAGHLGAEHQPKMATVPKLALFATRSLRDALMARLYRLCFRAPHWRVGWRFVDGPGVVELGRLPDGGWHDLPDDRKHFYADPFPVVRDGHTFVFVEDFSHQLGRAVISVVEFDASGPKGTPRPVLDIGCHASYPHVFEHRGEMWMVPETTETETVDLYRAAAFPGVWVKEATLLSNIAASDATLFEHDGRWWMLATVRDGGGSYSDVLHAWWARDPLGPWQAHSRNPILVDIASARPGGRVVRHAEKLIRPVQDCSRTYGGALGLAEIRRLDEDGFEQHVEVVLRPGLLWPGRRLHTLNRAGKLECVDGSRLAPKL